MNHHEDAEQAAVIEWAMLARIPNPPIAYKNRVSDYLYHPANGGKRSPREAARLKKQGVKAGVLDLHLVIPRPPYAGLWIEMKWGKNKPTDEQKSWAEIVTAYGSKAIVCYSAREAIDAIVDYLQSGNRDEPGSR